MKATKKRKTGRRNQHDSFLRTETTELMGLSNTEIDSALKKHNKGYDIQFYLQQDETFFKEFLKAKGLPYELKTYRTKIPQGTKIQHLIAVISEQHDEIPGAICAARGLTELKLCADLCNIKNFEQAMIHLKRASYYKSRVQLAIHEPKIRASANKEVDKATKERIQTASCLKEKAQPIFNEYKSKGHSNAAAYKFTSKRLKKETGHERSKWTIKKWMSELK